MVETVERDMTLPAATAISSWLPLAPVAPASLVSAEGAPSCWLVEYRISLQALPYLADHGFHDMVVLPGSFYVALVRQIHSELFQREATSLRHINFARPAILTDELPLTIRVAQCADDRVVYELFEAEKAAVEHSVDQPLCARLEVDFGPTSDVTSATLDSTSPFVATEFYQRLRSNGNEYGPHFQNLTGVRHSNAHAEAEIQDSTGDALTPPVLDAAPQLLASVALERGRTFILKSIDHVVIHAITGPGPWSLRAQQIDSPSTDDSTLLGSIAASDASGNRLWECLGVTLAFIDRPEARASSGQQSTTLCVAATFTADPLEDSLRFWGEHFKRPVRVEFAPYNQVFQQLLDPGSAFRTNRDGVNLVVLALEDWLPADRHTLRPPNPTRAATLFGDRSRATLPNGLEIVQLNSYETDYVYQEIFEDQSYLRHDIQLADGDTVIDIGANIGLFSLFVMSRCQDPEIYAFEPSPRVFDLLQANCAAYGNPARVHAFNCGVAEKKGQAQFTFYEHSSVFSSFHPDAREDRAAVEAVVRNVMENELAESATVLDADVDALTADRLRAQSIDCALTSVSDIIRENEIRHIHLLKIDAEKSELGILRGIDEDHWPMIDQIVMEVHDRSRAAVREIEEQLSSRGFRCAVVEEKLLEDSGLFNIYATRRTPVSARNDLAENLGRKVDEFCRALDSFAAAQSSPLVLAITPRAPSAAETILSAAEDQIVAHGARHSQVHSIHSKSIRRRYPVRQLHDAHSHQLGHMPFTTEGYTAIGTALSRAIFNLDVPPVKVIALDCDNTLWQGLCAEDGPKGVAITAPFEHLQEFVVRLADAGVLVALCSKNQEADVFAVFDQRTDLPLRREHLAGWRINWETKPANLRALAAQFNLGLDSFVFLDDNPVECAAVRAECPEVTVLQLPEQTEQIPAFLESLWIFDRTTTTREDRERTQWYRANSERDDLRNAAPTLRDFLDGLQLEIKVTEPTDDQLERVAQLTLRTNQFNLTTIRRSESEIRELLKSGARCLVTTVRDRFGDYGLVGAILYTAQADRYLVDTLLLSCRALGKGVEHRMVAELASRALQEGKFFIDLPYRPTERNEPARAFLEKIGPDRSVETLANLRYAPEEQQTNADQVSAPLRRNESRRTNFSAALQQLAENLNNVSAIVAAIESVRTQGEPAADAETPENTNGLEQTLISIWKKALGRARIGVNENFFDVGGTSLKAVVVVAMIRKELHKNISIVSLFECPTIALLAAKLDEANASIADSTTAANAESRGRQRRIKLVKRRVA